MESVELSGREQNRRRRGLLSGAAADRSRPDAGSADFRPKAGRVSACILRVVSTGLWHVPCLNGSASMSTARLSSDPASGVEDPNAGVRNADRGSPGLQDTLGTLLERISRSLGVPIALLSRDGGGWRFEADSFADAGFRGCRRPRARGAKGRIRGASAIAALDAPWTGLFAGTVRQREWLLMMPGRAEQWRDTPGLQDVVDQFGRSLEAAVHLDDERSVGELHRTSVRVRVATEPNVGLRADARLHPPRRWREKLAPGLAHWRCSRKPIRR